MASVALICTNCTLPTGSSATSHVKLGENLQFVIAER
jgi:hypothetical protein